MPRPLWLLGVALALPAGCQAALDDENAGWPAGTGAVLWTTGSSLERAALLEDPCVPAPSAARAPMEPRQRSARVVREREAALRCELKGRRFSAESVPSSEPCVYGGLRLRIGGDEDGDGAISAPEAERSLLFCGAHPDREVLPRLSAPVSGPADRLRLPLPIGLDLDGDGALRASEAAFVGEPLLPEPDVAAQVRWLAPCQRHKWKGKSAYRACDGSGANVIALDRVSRLARVQVPADVTVVRDELVRVVFGPNGLPTRGPDAVSAAFEDPRFSGELDSLASIERLEIALDAGLSSVAYLFLPQAPSGELFLYHEGHDGGFWLGRPTIAFLLDHGFAVLALAMPLRGYNSRPGPGSGWWNHNHLWRLDPAEGSEIRYFLEPAVVSLNHALAAHSFTRVHAIGISGGGWSLTALAAIDPRVSTTFAVAGSLPHFARRPTGAEWGDREQAWRTLYREATYLDLYLLGGIGEGRRFFQMANEDDDCCFKGVRHASYAGDIAERAAALGGSFTLWIDEGQTSHAISEDARAFVLEALGR